MIENTDEHDLHDLKVLPSSNRSMVLRGYGDDYSDRKRRSALA